MNGTDFETALNEFWSSTDLEGQERIWEFPSRTGFIPLTPGVKTTKLTTLCRDVSCPLCGYFETFAAVNFQQGEPGAELLGCRKCGWRSSALDLVQTQVLRPVREAS